MNITSVPLGKSVLNSKEAIAKELGNGSVWNGGGLNLPKSALFGTDGIRGRVGDFLTAPLAVQVGFWAGQVLKAQSKRSGPVILGQDSRNSSNGRGVGQAKPGLILRGMWPASTRLW